MLVGSNGGPTEPTPVAPNGGLVERPIAGNGEVVGNPHAEPVAPPIPDEITEPIQPDRVLHGNTEMPLQAEPHTVDRQRSSTRSRRPPPHLADFDCT